MTRFRALVAAVVLASVVTGCGDAEPSDGKAPDGKTSDGNGNESGNGGEPAEEKLAADSGTRYTTVAVPMVEGLVCDEGDGGFRYGSGLDVGVFGDKDLKEIKSDDNSRVSCFGSPRIILRKGTVSASVPVFTARTKLYEKVADPAAALNRIYDRSTHLVEEEGRNFIGEATIATSSTLVVKCRQNVTDTFPMTTCFWANYGAAGSVDFFPPDGQYVPVESAVRLTRDFVAGALKK
ncbi:hypothetical protein [Streptomyces sp. NPDC055632]